jgi:phosphoglycolate phosphatase
MTSAAGSPQAEAEQDAIVLFWDIDGTLLTTGRAGVFAWEAAIEEVLGIDVSLQDYPTSGLTDVEIARLLVEKTARAPDPERAARVLHHYEQLLPSRLHYRRGEVLPGVREILDAVRERDDVVSILLTGNTSAGAAAKLTHYDLFGYFGHGAFADGTEDRPSIARRALEIATEQLGRLDSSQTFVIGDTPHDIGAGDAIGARTVAVATGTYSLEQLAEHEPWWLLGQLPGPVEFLSRLQAK